jgi:HAD superfamily phosphatase (TIGR01668 family)
MKRSSKSRGARPDYCFDRVHDIDPAWLQAHGIAGLLLDIDNTLTRWEERTVPPSVLTWLEGLRQAGIACRLLSNGLSTKRIAVEKQTGIPHATGLAVKPFVPAFSHALRELGLPATHTMMIGDIVVTDIAPANQLGIWTSLVEPLSPIDFPGTKIWRLMENMFKWRRPYLSANDFRRRTPQRPLS